MVKYFCYNYYYYLLLFFLFPTFILQHLAFFFLFPHFIPFLFSSSNFHIRLPLSPIFTHNTAHITLFLHDIKCTIFFFVLLFSTNYLSLQSSHTTLHTSTFSPLQMYLLLFIYLFIFHCQRYLVTSYSYFILFYFHHTSKIHATLSFPFILFYFNLRFMIFFILFIFLIFETLLFSSINQIIFIYFQFF